MYFLSHHPSSFDHDDFETLQHLTSLVFILDFQVLRCQFFNQDKVQQIEWTKKGRSDEDLTGFPLRKPSLNGIDIFLLMTAYFKVFSMSFFQFFSLATVFFP